MNTNNITTADEAYALYEKDSKVPNNFDLKFNVFEYDPDHNKTKEDRFKPIVEGYFPYPRVFPFKRAHQFPKFMFESAGVYDPDTGKNVFNPVKGKYYTFILIYQFYRYKKKNKIKWKRFDVYYR